MRPHYKKYVAEIVIEGKKKCLGVFSTEEEAAMAYNEDLLKNGGSIDRCNVIERD